MSQNGQISVVNTLLKLKQSTPVEWDRYTVSDDFLYWNIFGWFPRTDEKVRDFILLQIRIWPDQELMIEYTTSSIKYTKEVGIILFGNSDTHTDCKKIDDFLNKFSKT